VLVRQSGFVIPSKVVFAPGADADDLKKAIIAELKLDAAPHRVRLLREVAGGGAPVPLDSLRPLAEQEVCKGASVVVEVLPPPPLPLHALSGVITRAPDAALDAGLLAALAGADTPDIERLEALSALVADHLTHHPAQPAHMAPALPLFHTVAHATLLRVLVNHARSLAAGYYVGINGAPCRTLVGARGIGKSALMRAFVLVAPSAFPSLLPVYLNGQDILNPQHVLHAGHLQSALAAAAALQDLPFCSLSALPKGRRLLLLVDEFDDLYRVPANRYPALAINVLTTLSLLSGLGDRTDGNSSVLLCGSSSATYSLVQGMGARLERTFPLVVEGIPDLNSTKFERLRLPAPLCSDSAEVAAMLAAMAGSGGWVAGHARSTAAARLLTFFVGATPRAVARAVHPLGIQELTGEQLAGACPDTPPDAGFVHPGTGAFLRALLARLAEKNSELRALTRKSDGSANFQAIMDPACRWEQAVVPLTMIEVEAVFQGVTWSAATAADADLPSMLNEIADKHLLRVHHPSGLDSAQVWPVTAAQAVAGGLPGARDLAGAAAAFARAAKELALVVYAVKTIV
jgi:hypothetical protein